MKRLPILLALLALAGAVSLFPGCKQAASEQQGPTRVAFTKLPDLAEQLSGAKAYEHVRALTEIGPRPAGSPGYAKALEYLEQELAKCGWKTQRQNFRLATPKGTSVDFTNLLARTGTPDWSKSVPVVIGGHLDSKEYAAFRFVGANDGGSSSGLMVELARVLATDPSAAAQVELVFFDGEEAFLEHIAENDGIQADGVFRYADGLYGSKYYARQMSLRPTWPAVGVVLDLIGDNKYPARYNPAAGENFASAVTAAGKDSGMEVKPYFGYISDDHIPLQNTGLTMLHLIGDFQSMPYWHKEGDTIEVIDAEALEQTGRTVLRFLARVQP